MLARRALLLAVAFALFGGALARSDDVADRAKLRDTLMERELESWGMMKKKDLAAMREFLADDAVLIFSDAVRLTKADFIKLLADYTLESFATEGKPDIVMLTPDAATITYRITYTSAVKGGKSQKVTVLSSSTYARRGGKWVNVYYQETQAK